MCMWLSEVGTNNPNPARSQPPFLLAATSFRGGANIGTRRMNRSTRERQESEEIEPHHGLWSLPAWSSAAATAPRCVEHMERVSGM